MSDAEPNSPAPSDSMLENQLRLEVKKRFRDGTQETVTINQIRQAAEKSLGLRDGWYAGPPAWKARSKTVIHEEMDKQQARAPSSAAIVASASPAEVTSRSKPVRPAHQAKPPKRTSPDEGDRSKKRFKKSGSESESEDPLSSPPSEFEEERPTIKPKAKPRHSVTKATGSAKRANGTGTKVEVEPGSPLSDSQDVDSETMPEKPKNENPENSGSEMSVVIDEGPKPKRRKRKSAEAADEGAKKSKAPKIKADAEIDPDEAEIKRLQGWLVKCGIRKMWWKELKPYESSKAKIKHLKNMLSEAGMMARYSQEKATQIKEARELAADIEAVKEGAERWGKGNEQSEEDGGSKRRLVRGAKNYDFLSSDGEETD